MDASRAGDDDLERVVEWSLAQPPSALQAWVLEPAPDEGARRVLCHWAVAHDIDLGLVLIADDGRPLGGLPHPYPDETHAILYRRPRSASGKQLGHWLWPPDLPTPCQARLYQVAKAVQILLPPRPVHRLTVGDVGRTDGPFVAEFGRLADRPLSVITARSEGDGLPALGFEVVAEVGGGRDGRPPLTSWLRA